MLLKGRLKVSFVIETIKRLVIRGIGRWIFFDFVAKRAQIVGRQLISSRDNKKHKQHKKTINDKVIEQREAGAQKVELIDVPEVVQLFSINNITAAQAAHFCIICLFSDSS